jgi:hypothetical protein
MLNREAYRAFVAAAPDVPLFLQPWYLDAVCAGGAWGAVLAQKGGRTVAALPFFLKKKWGRPFVAMPPLGKFHGPYLLPEFRSPRHETALYDALLDQLPRGLAAFEQDFNYAVQNWLPFYWRGFRQTTRYSYTLSLAPPESLIFNNIAKDYRRKIRAAESQLEVKMDGSVVELYRLVGLSFARQGLKVPISEGFVERVVGALSAHSACQLFFATDPRTGALHSAALMAWDAGSAYYLLSGDDPALRGSGSALLLKWAAIRHAKNVAGVPVFDFEGSMIRAIETGRRAFGAEQRAYFRVQREWSALWRWGKFLLR